MQNCPGPGYRHYNDCPPEGAPLRMGSHDVSVYAHVVVCGTHVAKGQLLTQEMGSGERGGLYPSLG